MNEKINLLKSLPISKKPLEKRKQAELKDRRYHWKLGQEYFDGTREQGYGGYSYDGRWKPVANDIINHYKIKKDAKILDIGCAKGFLLYELKKILPDCETWGVDISTYAVSNSHKSIKENIIIANAKELPFESNYFDLVISINSLHNILNVNETIESLMEIMRVTKTFSFISLGAYVNDIEKRTLDDWAVVGTTYAHEIDWLEIFKKSGYTGDYWWFKPK